MLKNCGKKSDSSSKIGGKFSKKSSSDLAQNWLSCSLKEINFANFGTFATFFAKSEKNLISSLKSGKKFTKDFLVKKKINGNSI